MTSTNSPVPSPRQVLRQRLLGLREQFSSGPQADAATRALAGHLKTVIEQLEPQCLGLYWPMRFEFNPELLRSVDAGEGHFTLTLPFCRREPRQMHYRVWDGATPRIVDECRIPASDGPPAVPDVVLAPCLGFTASGYRLGYGGGYFDRWLAVPAHAHATVIGVAWSCLEIDEAALAPQPHDLPMALVVTERGVVR